MVIFAVIMIVAMAAMIYTMSNKGAQDARAQALDPSSIPTASKDRVIPLLLGTRWIKGSNVCDYGNYSSSPIKKSM